MFKWRKFQNLSGMERWLLVQAFSLLLFTAPALRLFGFKRLSELARRVPMSNAPTRNEAELATLARTIARTARIAADQVPYPVNCLQRSIVLWWLLRRYGIKSDLRVGVRKSPGQLEAHAWVECLGNVLNDGEDVHSHFAPFDRAILPVEVKAQ